MDIPAASVRLNPKLHEGYTWKILDEKKGVYTSIFSKNLSDHSIGVYRLLSAEVGRTFEAVSSLTENMASVTQASISLPKPNENASFTSEIRRLTDENCTLSLTLSNLSTDLEQEYKRSASLEEENTQLSAQLETLEQESRLNSSLLEKYHTLLAQCFPPLDELRNQLGLGVDNHVYHTRK